MRTLLFTRPLRKNARSGAPQTFIEAISEVISRVKVKLTVTCVDSRLRQVIRLKGSVDILRRWIRIVGV